ncbi:MAG: High-affinity branched-chain amino acid transport ATP-binding protein LivF [Syntrophorhabdus sp. PtaU1.Bin002]|nr:MAG: High-affinity branched-chain amino acid transport ATP-binding protein LivF [Syntrophorhabdus sp. PtaB.Bin006]OPY73442.1 MAG: High-affinity branched-chain amino acid transport ATP-binding protein LivF [Syntrophorhabdus sp. PtaU1.Bin002]
MLMKIEGLSVNYGAIRALDDVTVEVRQGEVLSVIGANGAGKSTLLRTITGIVKPVAGTITFNGTNIKGLRPDKIVRLGIMVVPEGRRIFPDLSVKENLELGGHAIDDRSLKKELYTLILATFPRLKERLKQHAGTLSGGEQQMLAMGRALMGNPKLLLLDEPSMGLSPIVTREIFSLIGLINKEKGISMILVEQNAHMALEHSERAYVLENGRITLWGPSAEIKSNPGVVEAYLGV